MSYGREFIVEPGSKLRLGDIDPSYKDKPKGDDKGKEEIERNLKRLRKSQFLLYADARKSLLVVLQGMDASGKDGAIQAIFSGVNPQGVSVVGFKQPSATELAHDFLWRVHARAPAKGEITIFNRSHYEDVLVVRVRELVSKSIWSKRYDMINGFEKLLAENGTKILKFFLHISPEEQLERFKDRLDDSNRQWKISETDYTDREFWPLYMEAYQDALSLTSTKIAPWYVIPSNRKWFRNLAIAEIIADTLDEMDLKVPPPRVDIADIRRKYYAATQKGNGD